MNYKVLLLTLVFVVVAEGQSTALTTPSTLATKADQGSTKVADDSSSSSEDSTEEDSTEEDSNEDDMKPAESLDKFTFTQADALKSRKPTLSTKPDNDLSTEGDDEDPIEELTIFEKLLSDAEKSNDDDGTPDANTKDRKNTAGDDDSDDDDDDDDDSDEDDDESDSKSDTNSSPLVSKPEDVQIRRQGDLGPRYGLDSPNDEESRQTPDNNKPEPVYIPSRDQAASPDIPIDSSPVLQLTEGGYQPPYQRLMRLSEDKQKMRSGSASQQSETLEPPRVRGVNFNQPGQFVPQVQYTAPYQPQLNLEAHSMFQHPGPFGGNRILPDALQNAFFHSPPTGFNEFSSPNLYSPFHPASNGEFSPVPRDQSGFPLFQTPPRQNSGLLFQGAPQYPQAQPTMDNHARPVQTFFQPGRFPNMDIVEDTSRPNFPPFMRHPTVNSQFQVNPNFYAIPPNSGANDFNNPMINMLQNYPGNAERQSFQPQLIRYPMPDSQITMQSSDQVEKQKQDSADPADTKSKYPEGMKTSQDKEDTASVPFGSRIRQNNAPNQNAFSNQRDVYLRYPVREAGYATEENLPVQNTTEKTTRNSDPSSSNPSFPFYTSPDEFRPFSNPDPYRNALNVLQQSFASDKRNADDKNKTEEDQYVRNVPMQFDDHLVRPSNQLYPPYQRNQQGPVFQNRPFYPVPGLEAARNPFYQLPGVIESRFLFSPPGNDRNGEESNTIPACAQDNNATVCFTDEDYPKRELLYLLNSNSLLMERLSSPSQGVEKLTLEDGKKPDDSDGDDNYICKSDIKYGLPLRAKNVKETWSVIVNMEDIGSNQFIQPVRLEICKAANQPCSYTQVKTTCVQKYNLQRLLSWSPSRGIYTDVYKLPVACSCQIVDAQS